MARTTSVHLMSFDSKGLGSVAHGGTTACGWCSLQDVSEAFQLGSDAKRIDSIDADGIVLASIQVACRA